MLDAHPFKRKRSKLSKDRHTLPLLLLPKQPYPSHGAKSFLPWEKSWQHRLAKHLAVLPKGLAAILPKGRGPWGWMTKCGLYCCTWITNEHNVINNHHVIVHGTFMSGFGTFKPDVLIRKRCYYLKKNRSVCTVQVYLKQSYNRNQTWHSPSSRHFLEDWNGWRMVVHLYPKLVPG